LTPKKSFTCGLKMYQSIKATIKHPTSDVGSPMAIPANPLRRLNASRITVSHHAHT